MKKIFTIIVNYHEDTRCLALLKQFKTQTGKNKFNNTVLLFDNNQAINHKSKFCAIYKDLIYLNSSENLGFSKAVNKCIRLALHKNADAVLLINPDIQIPNDLLPRLIASKADISGPVIRYRRLKKTIFDLGGKLNRIWCRTTHQETDSEENIKKINKQIDYLSGCCIMIKRRVFEKIGLLDERFFMYFEDTDFQLRARENGFTIKQDEKLTVRHELKGQSQNTFKPFTNIRHNLISNYQFIIKYCKNWHLVLPLVYLFTLSIKILLNGIIYFCKRHYQLITIFLLGLLLRSYLIIQTLVFNHEIGRDYLAATRIAFYHETAYLGPITSHSWLYHGPAYYYLLSLFLSVFNYSSYSGYFLALLFYLLTFALIYKISLFLFKKTRIALISVLIWAVLPIQVALDRLPAHYGLTGFYVLSAFFAFLLAEKNKHPRLSVMMAGFFAGIAVQLHYSSLLLFLFINLYLLFKNRGRNILLFNLLYGISLLPWLINDAGNHFSMLINLFMWLPYRLIKFGGAGLLILAFFLILAIYIRNRLFNSVMVFFGFMVFCLLLLFLHGKTPEHYYYFLFPEIVIVISYLLNLIYEKDNLYGKITVAVFLLIFVVYSLSNFYFQYLPAQLRRIYPPSLTAQINVTQTIIQDAKNSEFNIERIGLLDQFGGYLDNYRFLFWREKGNLNTASKLRYIIIEESTVFRNFIEQNFSRVSGIAQISGVYVVKELK